MKNILSLFDYTGNWPRPYTEAGYKVISWDIQDGVDIMTVDYKQYPRDYFSGILAAVPCTDFALSGARHFKSKDEDGRTYESMALVYKTLAIVKYFEPGLDFWVVENPMSRIHKLCPELGEVRLRFNPYDYAQYSENPRNDQYQKQTWLWGEFNLPERKPLENLDGCKLHKYATTHNEKNRAIRSATPMGFARAFAAANK